MPAARPAHAVRRLALPPGWSIGAHSHDGFHEIVAVVAGRIETSIDGRTRVDGPGMVKLQPRGVPHAERCVGDDPLELLVLCWNPGRGERCSGWPASVADDGRIARLLAWMSEPGTGARLATLLAETAAAAYAESIREAEPPLVARTRAHILAHLPEPIRLDDLARAAGMSRSYFARRFQRSAGLPPMRLVTALRVEAARDLILASDLPLRAIADRVGFSDESSLSHAIRQHIGCAPGALRRGV